VKLAAIVLAAGHARRFGADKLAADFGGRPLLAHAIDAARAAPVEAVFVVCREPPPLLRGLAVETVRIASDALSDSLRAGIGAAARSDPALDGVFVFLGDMPLVPRALAGELAARIGDGYACLPRFEGRPGHPVLLAARAFPDVAALEGDAGAGKLLRARDDVVFVDTDDEGVLLDVDSAGDLARLSARATLRD
jgi:molybdenum cofactor cytidylyltransferase